MRARIGAVFSCRTSLRSLGEYSRATFSTAYIRDQQQHLVGSRVAVLRFEEFPACMRPARHLDRRLARVDAVAPAERVRLQVATIFPEIPPDRRGCGCACSRRPCGDARRRRRTPTDAPSLSCARRDPARGLWCRPRAAFLIEQVAFHPRHDRLQQLSHHAHPRALRRAREMDSIARENLLLPISGRWSPNFCTAISASSPASAKPLSMTLSGTSAINGHIHTFCRRT